MYRTYVLIFLSAVFKLFLAIGPYRIALYPISRLVAVTKMNGIDPNLGLSQNLCYERKKAQLVNISLSLGGFKSSLLPLTV